MKSAYLVFILLSLSLACRSTAQTTATQPKPAAFVTWDNQFIDLGAVKKGEKRAMTFELTNTSGTDIKIDIVDACECTTTDYTHGTIKPGGKARVDAVFDSKDKTESETIEIRVIFTNTDADGNPRIELLKYKFDLVK